MHAYFSWESDYQFILFLVTCAVGVNLIKIMKNFLFSFQIRIFFVNPVFIFSYKILEYVRSVREFFFPARSVLGATRRLWVQVWRLFRYATLHARNCRQKLILPHFSNSLKYKSVSLHHGIVSDEYLGQTRLLHSNRGHQGHLLLPRKLPCPRQVKIEQIQKTPALSK